MFSKQLASDVVIVFLVQCSQGSEEQTGHQKQEEEEKKQCSLSNWLFLRKPVKIKHDSCIPLFSDGRTPVVQRLLELPKGTIDFSAVNNSGQTGYSVAHEKGRTAILELLATAGHGEAMFLIACKEGKEDDLRETLLEREPIVKSCGAAGFRVACEKGNEVTVKWFLQECQGLVDFNGKDSKYGANGYLWACYCKSLL